jgi:hypothetical protein
MPNPGEVLRKKPEDEFLVNLADWTRARREDLVADLTGLVAIRPGSGPFSPGRERAS